MPYLTNPAHGMYIGAEGDSIDHMTGTVELGQWLRSAREAKDVSLAQAETATRIRQKYLAALESGDWEELPGFVAGRGFLRNYATFLGLDSNDALARLGEPEAESNAAARTTEAVNGPRAVDYRPMDLDLWEDRTRGMRWVVIGLVAGVALILALTGWWLWANNPQFLASLLPAQPIPPTAIPAAVVESNNQATPTAVPTTAFRITATPTSGIFTLPTPTPTATRISTRQPTATPTSLPQLIEVIADARQRAWMRVTADGTVIFEQVMEADSQETWQAQQVLVVRTGNAGGVEVAVNGEAQGSLGSTGSIEECTWTLADSLVTRVCSSDAAQTPTATSPAVRAPALTATPTEIIRP